VDELSENTLDDLRAIEKILKINFKNKKLLLQAITHSSYKPDEDNFPDMTPDYVTLEHLGDAVMRYYLLRLMALRSESVALVELMQNKETLLTNKMFSEICTELGIAKFVRCSALAIERNPKILADVLEAIFGAYDLDQGPEAGIALFKRMFGKKLTDMADSDLLILRKEMKDLGIELHLELAVDTREYTRYFETRVLANGHQISYAKSRHEPSSVITSLKEAIATLKFRKSAQLSAS